MLRLSTDMRAPSIAERIDIMNRHLYKVGIPVDYDRITEHMTYGKIQAQRYGDLFMTMTGVRSLKDSDIAWWLRENGITMGFYTTPTGALSLSADSINSFLTTDYYHLNDLNKALRVLLKYKEKNALVSMLPGLLEKTVLTRKETEHGRRLGIIRPNVVPQNTGRFGYTKPAVQNLKRELKDIYAAPKGWRLISADSGQIEPKIIYGFYLHDKQIQKLIELYGDAYIAVLDYCTMDYSLIASGTLDLTAREVTPEMKEMRQRLKTYGNGVMYGSTSNPEKDPLKQAYIDRIGKHPKRIAWFKELETKLNNGQKVFPTIFGTGIDVYESEKYLNAPTPELKRLALEHCIINNPVQGTAADLMGFSLRASDELMRKKAPMSWIVKFTHDEGTYCVHNSEFDYVYEELSGHTSYLIDDKVRIFNDPIVGTGCNTELTPTFRTIKE